MAYTISADDVRNRLQVTETELSDTILSSAGFIPAGQVFVKKKLALAGYDYDELEADDQALVDAAGVAYVAGRVLLKVLYGTLKVGSLTNSEARGVDLRETAEAFFEEADQYLMLMGCRVPGGFYVSGSGHEDYEQDFRG